MFNFFKKEYYQAIFLFLSILSFFIGFYLNEDGSGSGAYGDFKSTFSFMVAIQSDWLPNPDDHSTVHTPLHFYILALFYYFYKSEFFLRVIFFISSFLLPIFFFKSLKIRFNTNKNLIILASIIFFVPAFRYNTIWPTDLITSLIFFQISILYFLKWQLTKKKYFDFNIFFNVIFLALATYCRQYFCVFFIFFLNEYFKILKKREFIKLFFVCVITSIPVLLYVYKFPILITQQHISHYSFAYFLIGNSSMMLVYLLPIILLNFYEKKIIFNLKFFFIFSLSCIFVLSIYTQFEYREDWLGGGVIYLISRKIFNSDALLIISSILTYFFITIICLDNKKYLTLFLILILVFFSFQVYQRYYEPMMFLILFSLIDSKYINFILTKSKYCIFLYFYYLIYLVGCHLDFIHNVS